MGNFDQDGLHADGQQDENNVRVGQDVEQRLDERHPQGLDFGIGGVQGLRPIGHLDGESIQLAQQVVQVGGNEINQANLQRLG